MPFKKGDVVEVIEAKAGPQSRRFIGKQVIVEASKDDGYGERIQIEGQWWKAERFKLAKPVELAFAVGAQVERTAPSTMHTVKGGKYTIKAVIRDPLGAITKFTLNECIGIYSVNNFKVVANGEKIAFDVQKWEPKVGEKVFVVGKDKHFADCMERYINNGVEYRIKAVCPDWGEKEIIHLENDYGYLRESLRPVWAGKVEQKAPPPPPPKPKDPEDLREHLYNKQKAKGLGSGLCSYAVEYGNGVRGFHIGDVCHARLNRSSAYDIRDGKDGVVKLAYGLRHCFARVDADKKEAYKEYVDYIINRSPWAVAFLTKDINEAFDKDLYMNVECNRHIIAGAAVALRSAQEYPERPVIFKMVKDLGHSEHTAWVFSCGFTTIAGTKDRFNYRGWGGGHDVVSGDVSCKELVKFFQQGYHNHLGADKTPYRTSHGNYQISNAIAEYKGQSIKQWLADNTKATVIGEGWGKKNVIDEKAIHEVANKFDNLIKGAA